MTQPQEMRGQAAERLTSGRGVTPETRSLAGRGSKGPRVDSDEGAYPLVSLAATFPREHELAFLTHGLLRRVVEIESQFSDLDLGLVDASVMAYADAMNYRYPSGEPRGYP